MQIRPFERKDFDRLLELAEEMRLESLSFRDCPIDRDKLLVIGEATINTPETYFGVVAEKHGEIIGFMIGFCAEEYFSLNKTASDLALYVIPKERGGHAAYAILLRFKSWTKKRGAKTVSLGITTGVEVERTKKLYKALGFKEIGPIFRKSYESAA